MRMVSDSSLCVVRQNQAFKRSRETIRLAEGAPCRSLWLPGHDETGQWNEIITL